MTKEKLDTELRALAQGARECEGINDSMAFDIADGWLMDNPTATAAIKKYYGATDTQGFVANRIC